MKRFGRIILILSFLGLARCGQMEALTTTQKVDSNSQSTHSYNGRQSQQEISQTISLQVVEGCDDSTLACQVVEKVNNIRVSHSLPQLKLYKACSNSAQAHAQDMAFNQYFSHTGLSGSSPKQRLESYGPSGLGTAENIGLADSDAGTVVQAWMDSPSHRANILNPKLTHTGVGAAMSQGNQTGYGNDYYFVQCFLMD